MVEYLCANCKWEIRVIYDSENTPRCSDCDSEIEGGWESIQALLDEIESLNSRMDDKVKSLICAQNENRELKDEIVRLRGSLFLVEGLLTTSHEVMCEEDLYDIDIYKSISKYFERSGSSYHPIEDLELSVRSYNVFKRHGINDIDSLMKLNKDELLTIRNINGRVIQEAKDKLNEYGLEFS